MGIVGLNTMQQYVDIRPSPCMGASNDYGASRQFNYSRRPLNLDDTVLPGWRFFLDSRSNSKATSRVTRLFNRKIEKFYPLTAQHVVETNKGYLSRIIERSSLIILFKF